MDAHDHVTGSVLGGQHRRDVRTRHIEGSQLGFGGLHQPGRQVQLLPGVGGGLRIGVE